MKNLMKKTILILVTTLLIVKPVILPVTISGEEVQPEATVQPEASPSPEIANNTEGANENNASSDTGNNGVALEPTPTPTPSSSPEPSPSPEASASPEPSPTPSDEPILGNSIATEENVGIGESASANNSIHSNTNTGENKIEAKEGYDLDPRLNPKKATPEAEIKAEDSVTLTTGGTDINTTSLDSEIVFHTINLYADSAENIDFANLFPLINQLIAENPDQEVINFQLENVGFLSNDVQSDASTGSNSIVNEDDLALIQTGDAYSLVTLLNKLNFTIINSKLHLATVNIFGNFSGNIILPQLNGATTCAECLTLNANSNAQVDNNIDSNATTGNNTVLAEDYAEIQTGDAQSAVNVINMVNTIAQNAVLGQLFINVFGSWTGDFLGWGSLGPQSGGDNLVLSLINSVAEGCSQCLAVAQATIGSFTLLENNVVSNANTGNNNIDSEDGIIRTGNAYSTVSLINLVNSLFANSVGFFGFINIFGNWTGDIAGAEFFQTQQPPQDQGQNPSGDNPSDTPSGNNPSAEGGPQEVLVSSSDQTSGGSSEQKNGFLTISQTNNAGEQVQPGDTVTFFVKVKNPSPIKISNAKLNLFLLKDGKNVGGKEYSLGDIESKKGVDFSTGFVLSQDAQDGEYIARATVVGFAQNKQVSASSDSSFKIFTPTTLPAASGQGLKNNSVNNSETLVLGDTTVASITETSMEQPQVGFENLVNETSKDLIPFLALGSFVSIYLGIRAYLHKDLLKVLLSKHIPAKMKLLTLKMFLF